MATFAKATFNAVSYAAFRPSYPPQVFKTVLSYHRGPSSLLLDLGCGHGLISRELAPSFTSIIGTDPSPTMITQAKSSTPSSLQNVSFREASAEDLSFIEDGSLDMVVAGQAAHWFDYGKVWPELGRKVRRGGTLAFWGYKDNIFVDYPKATKILDEYCYGPNTMGPFWEQPGRQILRDKYHDIRLEYEPGTDGPNSGVGELLMHKKTNLGGMEGYARTFSSYHNWMAAHPEEKARKDGGEGDIVDVMFDKMLEVEPDWRAKGENWRDVDVENEWGSVILLARKK
ncbi:putative Trans-aconitate 3-methyltransferase [Halenospora varia]|nr:putative Trans-aconitate 3-methyltransferase [Halenospora varia]